MNSKIKTFLISLLISNSVISQVPGWLQGTWEGSVEQSSPAGHEHYIIQIACQRKECKVIYPSLECEGNWEIEKVGKHKVKFKEVIDGNPSSCIKFVDVIIVYKKNYVLYKSKHPDKFFYNAKALIFKK